MKRVTLAMLFAAAVTVGTVSRAGLAQDPTRPAAPPVPPVPVTPGVTPAPRPAMAPLARESSWEVRESLREARESSREAMEVQRDMRLYDRGLAPMAAPVLMPAPMSAPMPPSMPLSMPPSMPAYASRMAFGASEGFHVSTPPAPWAQGDPADSVYRIAREALNRGEFGRAAKLFAEIRTNYPKSAYQSDSQYYEALARYRIGTTEELQRAATLLEPLATKVMSVSNASSSNINVYAAGRRGASDSEVAALYNRINGALAQRGDRSAAEKVAKAAAQGGSSACDSDDIQIRDEAMNALSQMDPAAAMPRLKRVLDRKDECSSELRRRVVFMLARRGDAESGQLLLATAKSDPSFAVRAEAINALPRLPGDVGLNALEDMLRTEQDERVQKVVVRSLTSSDNAKARSSMRALIDRKDAPLTLRIEAVNSFASDRATTDDAAYLRGLYGKADNDRLKEAIISTVSRMGGSDNDKWVFSIAQNTNESSQLRATAISRLLRSNVSIADLGKLYDASDSYNIRQQIVGVLAGRKEPEATDKLLDIVKNSTITQLRLQAINALGRKNDPRSTQLLNDLLEGTKKP